MSERSFVGYDYQEVAVKRGMESMYADGYENFGWSLEDTGFTIRKLDSVIMKFKRDHKVPNKVELTRLQRQFDADVSDIVDLEFSKQAKASVVAYVTGIIGIAFTTGSVLAATANMTLLCVILAIPALVGWVLPYFCYRSVQKKRTALVTPLIAEKHDDIYAVCEKANTLLAG